MDHSPIEVYVIPRELAQLAGPQAERDRDDEQRLEPAVGFVAVVQAELRAARTARRVFELGGDIGDSPKDDATLKTFKRVGGHVWLLPENPAYDPIPGDRATIVGKVVYISRTVC